MLKKRLMGNYIGIQLFSVNFEYLENEKKLSKLC